MGASGKVLFWNTSPTRGLAKLWTQSSRLPPQHVCSPLSLCLVGSCRLSLRVIMSHYQIFIWKQLPSSFPLAFSLKIWVASHQGTVWTKIVFFFFKHFPVWHSYFSNYFLSALTSQTLYSYSTLKCYWGISILSLSILKQNYRSTQIQVIKD